MKFLILLMSLLVAVGTLRAEESVVLGAEFNVTEKAGFQDKATLAFGGGVYLAVWQDGAESADFEGKGVDLQCARLSPDGKSIDPVGIVVCAARDNQLRPKVAFVPSASGGVFLVVWEDYRNGADGDIYGARVTPAGKVLDPEGFPIAAIKGRNQVYATVASNGKDFMVAWMDYWAYPTYGIAVTRVSVDGKVAQKDGTLLIREEEAKIKQAAEVARATQTMMAPWARYGFGGSGVGTVGFPDLLFLHDRYLLLYTDARAGVSWRVVPVSAEGDVTLLPKEPKSSSAADGMGGGALLDKNFNRAFVAGPGKGWMIFTGHNSGRGQEEQKYRWLCVKPDGTRPSSKTEKGMLTELNSHDGRAIIDCNRAGAFDGTRYWIAIEHIQGIAAGRMDAETGALMDFSLGTKNAKPSAVMLSEATSWCMHPAMASDGKGGVMAVWSEDAGVDHCRLKARSLKTKL